MSVFLVFEKELLFFSHGKYEERAHSVTKRQAGQNTNFEIKSERNLNFNLNNASIFNLSKEIKLKQRTEGNQFFFEYCNHVNKRPPYQCMITIYQSNVQRTSLDLILSLPLTMCTYNVHRDIYRKEGIVASRIEHKIYFQVEDIPYSSLFIYCEDVSYPTIFGGDRMRDKDIFQSLQSVGTKKEKSNNNHNKRKRKFSNENPSKKIKFENIINNNNDNTNDENNNNIINDVQNMANIITYFNQNIEDNNNTEINIQGNNEDNINVEDINLESILNNIQNDDNNNNNNNEDNEDNINVDDINNENKFVEIYAENSGVLLPIINRFSFDTMKDVADDKQENFGQNIENNLTTDNENLGEINQNVLNEISVSLSRGYFTNLLLNTESAEDI